MAGEEIAKSVIDALKSRPDFIVLLCLNVVFVGIGYFVVTHRREADDKARIEMIERCVPNREKTV